MGKRHAGRELTGASKPCDYLEEEHSGGGNSQCPALCGRTLRVGQEGQRASCGSSTGRELGRIDHDIREVAGNQTNLGPEADCKGLGF